jgi:tRNA (guanine-N7-)-methyltransferase
MTSQNHSDPLISRRRAIRSFVLRQGRITLAQSKALEQLWPAYGLNFTGQILDLDSIFQRQAPRTLEIGFGDGESLVTVAAAHPERDYLGIEVHEPGVGHCLLAAQQAELKNLKVMRHDAVEVLKQSLKPNDLDEVLIYFPDPWPKTKHHKRRIIQTEFVQLLGTRIQALGRLRLATDWAPYADWMLDVLSTSDCFENAAADHRFVTRPAERPVTKFERRGLRLGHLSHDLEFIRKT